jgi:hypothetical protein
MRKGVSKSYDNKFYVGEVFGLWTVIDPVVQPPLKTARIVCKCACGLQMAVLAYKLLKGKTKGCRTCTAAGSANSRWCGVGEIPGSYFSTVKSGALQRGITFDITIDDMWNQWLVQSGSCAYTGVSLILSNKSRNKTWKSQTASLDRIDSDIGYRIDNIQWIHKDINRMKNSFSSAQFLTYCHQVSNYANRTDRI